MIPMGKIIVQRLHEIVTNGELGYDYTLDLRRKKIDDFVCNIVLMTL